LQSQLSLIPAEHSRSRWELYDSDDGHLISASMILVCEERGLHRVLQLRQLRSGGLVATAPLPDVFRWPRTPTGGEASDLSELPSMPPVADLPGGSLRKRLQTLLGDRRLGWVGALQIRQWRFDARDDADKTVARLVVEYYGLLRTPDARAEPCGKQLVLESLRGYRKPAHRIEHLLRAHLGLAPAPHLLERALALLGKLSVPAEHAKPEIDESMPAPIGVARMLLWLLADIETQESGVQTGQDMESLHDFRVAVRTTEVVSKQLGAVFQGGNMPGFIAEFSWLGKIAGATRDLDVALQALAEYRTRQDAETSGNLESLAAYLRICREQEHVHLCAALASSRYRRIKMRWRKFLNLHLDNRPIDVRRGIAERSSDAPATPATRRREKTVAATVRQRGARLCQNILREGGRLAQDSSGNAFHDLRKNCKKLSYLMALFPEIFPANERRRFARKLKRVQRNLGAHQDMEVQMALIQRFLRDDAEGNALAAAERAAVEKLIGWYRDAKTTLRSEFFAHFRRIQHGKIHERLRALFKTRAD